MVKARKTEMVKRNYVISNKYYDSVMLMKLAGEL